MAAGVRPGARPAEASRGRCWSGRGRLGLVDTDTSAFRDWQLAIAALRAAEDHGESHANVLRLCDEVIRTRNSPTVDHPWEVRTSRMMFCDISRVTTSCSSRRTMPALSNDNAPPSTGVECGDIPGPQSLIDHYQRVGTAAC